MALTMKSLVSSVLVVIALSFSPATAETRREAAVASDIAAGAKATLEGAIENGKQWSSSLLFRAHGYNRVAIFGDSLSDEGNSYALSNNKYPPSPPYGAGYYSNGPTWVKSFAESLGLTAAQKVNLAYGGATSTDSIIGYGAANNTVPVPSVETQISKKYLPSLPTTFSTKDKPISYDLHFVAVGSNDFIQKYNPILFQAAANPATTPDQLQQVLDNIATEVLAKIFKNVDTLYANGARTILVSDFVDPTDTPFFTQSPIPPAVKDAAKKLVANLNQRVAETVCRRQAQYLVDFVTNPQSLNIFNPPNKKTIGVFGIGRIFKRVISKPATFGITDVKNPCFANGKVCANPDAFLFWDVYHPTARVHKIIASEASRALVAALISDPTIGN